MHHLSFILIWIVVSEIKERIPEVKEVIKVNVFEDTFYLCELEIVWVSLSCFLLYESYLSGRCSIPAQIRDLTSDLSYSSASGQCKTAPVTQSRREQLSKRSHECVFYKIRGEGQAGKKGKRENMEENDKGGGRKGRQRAWSGFRQDNRAQSDIWALSLWEG